MPFVDEADDIKDDMGTAGANPLSQGQGQAQESYDASSDANQAASAGSGAISGQSVDQATSSGGTTNKKAPKASSGMFNNIQNYVAKNKPQAQKMSGAVTQDFSKQAGEIRQAAQEKKTQQDNLINTNTGLIGAKGVDGQAGTGALGAAQSTVKGIMDSGQAANADQQKQFTDLMGGKVAGVQQVGDLNIAKQQMRTDALSKLAQGSNTEEGRRNLLGSTFQKQGKYTRGMSGLDNLITSGDKGARENLIQGTQGVAGDLNKGLGTMSQEAASAKTAQELALGNLGADVTGMASGEETGLDTNIQGRYDQAVSDRQSLLSGENVDYQRAMAGADAKLAGLKDQFGGSQYADLISSMAPDAYNEALNRGIGSYGDAATTNLQGYADNLKSFSENGYIEKPVTTTDSWGNETNTIEKVTGAEAEGMLKDMYGARGSHFKNKASLDSLSDLMNDRFASDDLYGIQGIGGRGDLGTARQHFSDQVAGLGSSQDVISKKLAEVGGTSFADLKSGADIGKYETADRSQIDKINALKSLMGKTDTITDQQIGDNKYASYDSLKNMLGRYAGKGSRS